MNVVTELNKISKYSRDELKQAIRNQLPAKTIRLNQTTVAIRSQYIRIVVEKARSLIKENFKKALLNIPRQQPVFTKPTEQEIKSMNQLLFDIENIQTIESKRFKTIIQTKTRKQIIKDINVKLNKLKFPFTVQAVANITDGRSIFIQRKSKFAHTIKNKQELAIYIETIIQGILDYAFLNENPELYITEVNFNIINNRNKILKLRVAKYQLENCLINIIRNAGRDVEKVYKKYPDLRPNDVDKPIYVDQDMIKGIASTTECRIMAYTSLGYINNEPWLEVGKTNGKRVHVKFENEHATIVKGKLKVSTVVYLPSFDTIPTDTNIVEYDWYLDNEGNPTTVKYYLQMIDNELTMYKTFRPSSVSFNEEDDNNTSFYYDFDQNKLMYSLFKIKYNLSTIKNDDIKNIVKQSEHFIGRRVLEPIEPNSVYTEYDHNKNYISYEKSQYYQGFPTNNLKPVKLEHSVTPAFIVVNNITNLPLSYQYLYNYESGTTVITYPIYKYLLQCNAIIDVDFVLDSVFQDISVFDFAESCNISDDDKKLFRNQLIGRTITGGLKESVTKNIYFSSDSEKDQLIYECQKYNYPFDIISYIKPNETNPGLYTDKEYLKVVVPHETKGFFNFHSYILSYAALFMLEKWDKLEQDNKKIIGYNVDALLVKGSFYEHSNEIGEWKTGPMKPYYNQFKVSNEINNVSSVIPNIRIPTRVIPLKDTIISGAAGISKSYPWLNDPAYDQIMLAPTRELANNHKLTFSNSMTAHKYFRFELSDKNFHLLRMAKKIPREHQIVVIDEYTMFNKAQWDTIHRRKGNSTIIALGDPCQISNCIDSVAVNEDYFHNYDRVVINREADKPARHSFEFGTLLDGMRNLSIYEQKDYVLKHFEATDLILTNLNLSTDKIVSGNHSIANSIHKKVKELFSPTTIFPFKLVSKNTIVLLPLNTPNVFWDRIAMTDKAPKLTKYEPALVVTPDSLQGKTITSDLYIDVASTSGRKGTLYTAVTRTKSKQNIKIIKNII